jgi:hypothetical protein
MVRQPLDRLQSAAGFLVLLSSGLHTWKIYPPFGMRMPHCRGSKMMLGTGFGLSVVRIQGCNAQIGALPKHKACTWFTVAGAAGILVIAVVPIHFINVGLQI